MEVEVTKENPSGLLSNTSNQDLTPALITEERVEEEGDPGGSPLDSSTQKTPPSLKMSPMDPLKGTTLTSLTIKMRTPITVTLIIFLRRRKSRIMSLILVKPQATQLKV